jgi:hypothetical protein
MSHSKVHRGALTHGGQVPELTAEWGSKNVGLKLLSGLMTW